MSELQDDSDRLGSLFVSVTGETTVTERQHTDVGERFDDRSEASDVANYLSAVNREDGLDDVIEEPEAN